MAIQKREDDSTSAPLPGGTEGIETSALALALALENISNAFFILDPQWRISYFNPHAERLLSRTREELLGRNIWAEFPEAIGTESEYSYRRAVEGQDAASFEQFFPPLDAWFEAHPCTALDGIAVYVPRGSGPKKPCADLRGLCAPRRSGLETRSSSWSRATSRPGYGTWWVIMW